MRYINLTVESHFSSGHVVAEIEECSREHGHDFTVTATVESQRINAKTGSVVDTSALAAELDAIAHELHGKNLLQVLPGIYPTAEGLALYFRERLSIHWDHLLSEVSVSYLRYRGAVR